MNKTYPLLNDLYSLELHEAITLGKSLPKNKNDGINIVVLRLYKKNQNIIIYKNIYYNKLFINTLITYLLLKEDFKNTNIFKEWGDYYTLISEDTLKTDFSVKLCINPNIYNIYFREHINFTGYPIEFPNYLSLIDIIKKTTNVVSFDGIVNNIHYISQKKYKNIFNKMNVLQDDSENIYLLKDCLFVVNDINILNKSLSDKGYRLIKGPVSVRGELDSSTVFLTLLDSDYRNWLYNLHTTSIYKGNIPPNAILSKSRFSYRNIHMNLGNIKHYSTFNKRDTLYQENYNIIRDILQENYNTESKITQIKIENLLFDQETLYSDLNKLKKVLNFNDETFNLISDKTTDLYKLLDRLDVPIDNSTFMDNRYIPIAKDIISKLSPMVVAKILISYFMEVFTKQLLEGENKGISTLEGFQKFGKKIFGKYLLSKYNEYKSINGEITFTKYLDLIKKDYDLIYNIEDGYTYLGSNFIWNLITVKLIAQKIIRDPEDPKKGVNHLVVLDSIVKTLIKDNIKLFHLPQKLPMICEPNKYIQSKLGEIEKLGGYLLNDEKYSDKLIRNKIGLAIKSKITSDNIIIDLVNGLAAIPYKVNKDTLNYIYKYGIEKDIILNESCEKIKSYLTNKDYKKSKDYKKVISRYFLEKNILSIADLYSNISKIYFPLNMDFRGRIFCSTDYFNYQSHDLAKGLLSFANPGCINKLNTEVIQYFKAYGANMYGNGLDKKSINYRCKWIDENSSKILDFEYNDIVKLSENKVSFISFCFEYQKFINFMNSKEKLEYYTYLPIRLDATCNGYQHLSLLTKEVKLLNKLNLSESSHDDDPNDFYNYVNDLIINQIDHEYNRLLNIKDKTSKIDNKLESLKRLQKAQFGRPILKRLIMKESYSAGYVTLINDVVSDPNFIKHGEFKNIYYTYLDRGVKLNKKDIVVYVKCLKLVMQREAPKIRNLSIYLDSIAKICTSLDLQIPWTLPSGLEVSQSYLVKEKRKVMAFSFTKSKYIFTKFKIGKYLLRRQKNALRPNLIHSLDASVIALLYKTMNNVSLYTVHDCFSVTADNVPRLINKLKLVYMKLYSGNSYLYNFDYTVKLNISTTFGDHVYKMGDNYINIPINNKYKKVEFPDINKVINYDKNNDISILSKACYPVI